MKFADGYWRLQPGLTVAYPHAVHEAVPGEAELTVHAPTRPVEGRADTVATPLVTVRCTSPLPDVIRVSATHHAGAVEREPRFALASSHDDAHVAVEVTDERARLQAGSLEVAFDLDGPFVMRFSGDGRALTQSGHRSLGVVDTDAGEHYVHERLTLDVGESVYGFGERFTAFVKNGQSVEVFNDDGGTASDLAYKSVPFYLTNRGYGVFVDTPDRVAFEVGSELVSKVQFSVKGQTLAYCVIYGPTPLEILEKYTALTGRPALPPAWSFGLWLSTSFTTDYDEATVTSFVEGMAERDLPLSVVHFDCFWMRPFRWCDFEWDPETFPDPAGMLRRLADRGLRICVWINPYIAQRSALFEEGRRLGHLLRRPDGSVYQRDRWQAGMGLVDFTSAAARDWWSEKLGALLDMGVDCFKTDFGEEIPTDVVYADGSDPERMHNYYTYLYNRTAFETVQRHKGADQAVLFARSATVGSQQFPVHWGGDPEATYVSMAETLRGGLSLGASGFGFWSHDIGGFEQTPTEALFKRWCAFGLLSSHSRLHGSVSYRVPWAFGDEAVDVMRHFTRLKLRLMPYLYGAAHQAHRHGAPMMRAMALAYPADPACAHLDRQYLLGDSLLVAPVFSDAGEVTYYVPDGEWTDFHTGARVLGPAWRREDHDFFSLPLLVRPASLVATGAREDRPDYDHRDGVTIEASAFAPGESAQITVPGPGTQPGATFTLTRTDDRYHVVADTTHSWQLLLLGVHAAARAAPDATVRATDRGLLIAPGRAACELTVTLTDAA